MLNFAISHEEFVLKYFEQQPMLRPGAFTGPPAQWQDLDAMLFTLEPDEQVLQMFLNGQVPPANFLDPVIEFGRNHQRINKHRFYDLLQNGASLVINRAENYGLAAKRLCQAVGKFAQQPASSNAYISFAGTSTQLKKGADKPGDGIKTGTFGKHWDTHDVFAIQLIGQKRWQLYPPTLPLPLSHQTSRQSQHPSSARPAFECVLDEGDLLYIPRGWWHEVTPLGVDSLHLSVGTYGPTLTDYVMWVCSRQLPQLLDARRGCDETLELASTLELVAQFVAREITDRQNLAAFTGFSRAREHLSDEFHTAILVGKNSVEFKDTLRLALTSVYAHAPGELEIAVNGGRLKLSPVSLALVTQLNTVPSLSWQQACQRLPEFPVAVIQTAVLDLIRFEIISLNDTSQSVP